MVSSVSPQTLTSCSFFRVFLKTVSGPWCGNLNRVQMLTWDQDCYVRLLAGDR